MRTEVGELKLVFCVNLPPKVLHGWLKENAPEFGGWHPTHGRGSVLQLDVDKDADEIAQRWMHAYQYVDLVDRTEVHARCRYFFLAQPFDIFLGNVAARFPEARASLREELEDPYLARNLPHLREVLESITAEPETLTLPTSVINVGSAHGSSADSLHLGSLHMPETVPADGISLEATSILKTIEDSGTRDAPECQPLGESVHSESSWEESPLKLIANPTHQAMVIKMINGYTDPEIARQLGVSPKTVSNRFSELRSIHPELVPTRRELRECPDLKVRLLSGLDARKLSGRIWEVSGSNWEGM